jgi:hypothetical protein
MGSLRKTSTASSTLSPRRSPKAWEWGYQSVDRLSKTTAVGFGLHPALIMAPRFMSNCQHFGSEWNREDGDAGERATSRLPRASVSRGEAPEAIELTASGAKASARRYPDRLFVLSALRADSIAYDEPSTPHAFDRIVNKPRDRG